MSMDNGMSNSAVGYDLDDEPTRTANDTIVLDRDAIADAMADEDELASSGAMTTLPATNASDDMPMESDASSNSSFKDQVKDTAQQAMTQTQQVAGQALDKAKDTVKSQLSSQKERAVSSLGSFTTALHQTGQQLRQNGQGVFGDYADSLANQADRAVAYLREHDVDDLTGEVENFARNQPALFIGGALVIGIALSRFLKSSASQSNQFSTASNPNTPALPAADNSLSNRSDSKIPEQVYGNADPSRHLDQFSDDAIPSSAPLSAHDYVAGYGVSGSSESADA